LEILLARYVAGTTARVPGPNEGEFSVKPGWSSASDAAYQLKRSMIVA
jgi:hypothetical protein